MTHAPLTLYYSPGACSLAPHILLEETGERFAAERYTIAEGAHRRPEYLRVNPHARVPALRVGDEVLAENVAVMTFIARRHPEARLIPTDDLLAARVYERLSFFASSVHIAFAQFWRAERFAEDEGLHAGIKEGGRVAILRYFQEIETLIAKGDWLVGEHFTAADTYPFVFYRWGRRIGADMNAYPAWNGHAKRVLARPSVQRALAREGLGASEFASG